ncbi:MAG: hypothetical protein ACLPHI_00010 [Terriglobales bacterium]
MVFARLADIGCAQTHSLGPEFVVSKAVSADYAEAWKFMMQARDFAWSRGFQIEHHRIGAPLPDCGAEFLVASD